MRDEKSGGTLPDTMLIEPGGKVVYAHQGEIAPVEMRRVIVDRLGREKGW
jgi:hypothetical protein